MAAAPKRWLLYGANGYTGRLITALAVERGEKPILAGRSEEKIRPLAEKYGLDYRVFSLPPTGDSEVLGDVTAVLCAAGPFSQTSKAMVEMCMDSGTHYLDVTGEIGVFESIHRKNKQAADSGVWLIPGVGFDVVPTDCVAKRLHTALPNATHLQLAFIGGTGASAGTAKTAVEGLQYGNAERRDGKLKTGLPTAANHLTVPFDDKERFCVGIPWGDLSTSFFSTGIPNIQTYMATPRSSVSQLQFTAKYIGPLMRYSFLRGFAQWIVEKSVAGPDEETLKRTQCHIWGRVWNDSGDCKVTKLAGPSGYALTADAALEAVKKVVAGDVKSPFGSLTPSMAFGMDFVDSLQNVKSFPVEDGEKPN